MRAAPYYPRSRFGPSSVGGRTNMPSADFCGEIKTPCDAFSHDSATRRRSPEVSSTAFGTQPPDLQPAPLMDMGFVVICRLARHRMPRIWFLYIGSRLCSALLSDPPSPGRPCASLSLHLHQVVKGTFTPELSNMLGTQSRGPATASPRRRRGRSWLRSPARLRGVKGCALLVTPIGPSARRSRSSPVRCSRSTVCAIVAGIREIVYAWDWLSKLTKT
jgi:hypothetical protein